MAFDPFYIDRISECLQERFNGQQLKDAFSTSKEELYLIFDEVIKLEFYKGELFFQFPKSEHLPKRNRITQFEELKGLEVQQIQAVHLDRIFIMDFGLRHMVFHLFGKFSQLSVFEKNKMLTCFPKQGNEKSFPSLDKKIPPQNLEDAQTNYKWLNRQDLTYLKNLSEEDFQLKWDRLLAQKKIKCIELCDEDGIPMLKTIDKPMSAMQFLDILDQFSRRFIGRAKFVHAKKMLLQQDRKQIKLLRKKILKIETHLRVQHDRVSFKDQADLLMAYMHQVKAGQTEVVLPSFKDQQPVRISLNSQQSAQENAARFYRKSKKEHIQLAILQKELKELQQRIGTLELQITNIASAADLRALKPYIKKSSTKEDASRKPYKSMSIDGLELRIGKSAKYNDELLRLYSAPHDLWLHTANVAGSHVIVRLNRNQKLPDSTLEKVASIAAYYSKSRNEQLATVIYTYRKHVRKPKKAGPGKVLVQHEKSVLVKPTAVV